ncbi:MAG: leucine-rich repeat domain-containing protein [Prevotella sp.]|nr:leucine-rich repeat domain-containing protein [Prevotella sp.]
MKKFKHYALTVTFALVSIISVQAEVFKVDGINYNITSSTDLTCEVAVLEERYSGDIIIPSSVSYDGKTYSVTGIDEFAFGICFQLNSVTIPNSVTRIGDLAFFSCNNLTSITIPNSVKTIGDFAFQGCSGLTDITIPNSVTSIGYAAFFGCSELRKINVADGNPAYTSVEGILFNKEKTELIICPASNYITEYTIPNSVTSICSTAFNGCNRIWKITIPNSVTSIGDGAFSGCSELWKINVADDNPTYSSEDGVFFNKAKTELILFPARYYITDYTIPNSVTSIENEAFQNCHYLTSVTIPNSVTNIGYNAFRNCSQLKALNIPNSVTSIGDGAFNGCDALYLEENGILYVDTYLERVADQWKTSYQIKEGTRFIGDNAFNCCIYLTSIDIPNSVISIGASAFSGCCALISVTIPNSVTSIGDGIFAGCYSLQNITCTNPIPPSVRIHAFDDIDTYECTLYVPEGSVRTYRNADGWKDFVNIVGIDISGIEEMAVNPDGNLNTPAYNLQGVEVNRDYRGIVIRNGKKFLKAR